jgi:hypothetical protein
MSTPIIKHRSEYFNVELFDWNREQDAKFTGWPTCVCEHGFNEHNNFDPGGLPGHYPCEHGEIVDEDGFVVGGGCDKGCADYEPASCRDCGANPRTRTDIAGCRNKFHCRYDTWTD